MSSRAFELADYSLREAQPVGYYQGGQLAGSGGGNASTLDRIDNIRIPAGAQLVDYDFAELLPSSIAGLVFVDLDGDCLHDDQELTLGGVQINLLNAAGSVIETTLSDAQGRYVFSNLRPGTYSVREIQPTGYFHGGQVAPTSGGDASLPDVISGISLGSGQNVVGANFCEVPPAELSGYVFQDGPEILNSSGTLPDDLRSIRDGLRTADDTPLAGVKLQLRFANGQWVPSSHALGGLYSGAFIEVITDANGFYRFSGLPSGVYHVFQVQPADYMDGLDTPGSTQGISLNSADEVEAFLGIRAGREWPVDAIHFGAIDGCGAADLRVRRPSLAGKQF